MKRAVQRILRRAGIYNRVKSSIAYDLYWRLANSDLIEERNRELAFFRGILLGFKHGDLIFDIGANMGQKTDIFLRLGARVVAVDPDSSNQQVLRERFLEWRFRPKPVTIVGKAVSESNGTQTFWIDAPGSAKNTLNAKWVETLRADPSRFGESLQFGEKKEVETVTLDTLIQEYGEPAFIKIDVEGHEPAVLKGLRRRAPCISFEVNLPEFKPEAVQCVELLAALDPQGQFNFTPDCRAGFGSNPWESHPAFLRTLETCREPSIEVFWRSRSN